MTRLNIKPAAAGLYHHHYSPSSVSSIDFGDLQCSQIIECVKRDEWRKIKADGIMHIAPQQFPPYGKAYIKTAAFFVPEFELIEASDAFHSNQSSYRGVATKCPVFNSDVFSQMFASRNILSTFVAETTTPDNAFFLANPLNTFDFVYVINSGSNTPKYQLYSLTDLGKRFYKMFKSLGYDFPSFKYSSGIDYNTAFATGRVICNALPLLAYMKVFTDFFDNGVHYNNSPLVHLIKAIHDGRSFTYGGNSWYDASTGYLTGEALFNSIYEVCVPHESNLYTEAWNSPISPDGINPSSSMMSINPSGLVSPLNPVIGGSVLSVNSSSATVEAWSPAQYITPFGLRVLSAFDKYVRRNGLSGSKSVQKVYSRFGIKGEDFDCFYVHKLFEASERIKFAPIVSQSDTTNSSTQYPGKTLGSYAGYGSAALHFEFDYKCQDFGYIVVLHWLNVAPMLLRGMDPKVLRYNSFDFYTPEYDGVTVRGIPYCEISVTKQCSALEDKANYGFCNLYDDYRELRDNISGDFINHFSKNFVFCRDFSDIRDVGTAFAPQEQNIVL